MELDNNRLSTTMASMMNYTLEQSLDLSSRLLSNATTTIATTTKHPIIQIFHNQSIPKENLSFYITEKLREYHKNGEMMQLYPWFRMMWNSSNETIFSPCPSIQMPMGNLISMILYTIVCIVGLLGNTLVIYVVLRFSKMQTVTNMYILNLAIADQCFLIGIPFLITTMHLGEWTFGSTMCKAYMVSTSITQFTSSIFLFIMSADRYIAVCHPITSPRLRTPFISKIVSLIAWTTSVLFMIPVILYSNTITYPNYPYGGKNKVSCIIMWPQDDNGLKSPSTFTLYSLILGFAIPLALILIFYYLVIRKLRTVGPKSKSKEKRKSHRKVTKLVLTVITVYVLCWLPYWISQVALIHSPPDLCKSRLEITIFVLVGCLGYSNSAMNPVLYPFLSDNFRKSFLKACTCAKRKEINAQLQVENSFLTRFGRNRNSEKNNSTSKAVQNRNSKIGISNLDSAIVLNDSVAVLPLSNRASNLTLSTSLKAETVSLRQEGVVNNGRPPVLHTDL
ncbi:somatostatin receptor type 2-like [Culicoides brevitarsis]|uniref:somatostatin receptor type 2-like n=1 Tax=Culicoides brevitarsis TaxID=469753 RepID=UPI00307B28F1